MRKKPDPLAIMLMVIICAIWGSQQVAMKVVAEEMSPWLQVAIRSGLAALFLWLIFNRKDRILTRLASPQIALPGAIVGLLFALEFVLVATGITLTSASHIALYLYTAPLFSAVGLHFIQADEKLSLRQWGGLTMAFTGIAVAVLVVAPETGTGWSLTGDVCGLLAGMAWGITSIVIRCSRLAEIPPACTLFYQLASTGLILLMLVVLKGEWHVHWTRALVFSLLFQTVIVSFVSYLAWFTLLRHYHVALLGSLVLMTPAMGIAAGVFLLGEPLQPAFVGGALLILGGLLCVTLKPTVKRAKV